MTHSTCACPAYRHHGAHSDRSTCPSVIEMNSSSRLLPGVLTCLRTSNSSVLSSAVLFAAASTSTNGWVNGTRSWANWGHQLEEFPSTSYSGSASAPAIRTRSFLPRQPPSPSAYPQIVDSSKPLTVQYPFPIEYLVDRTTLVRSLVDKQPVGVELLPGAVYNIPVRIDVLHRCVRYLR